VTTVNALQRLISNRMSAQGWSYGDVARRGGLPRSTVHHLATSARLIHPPHPATLESLARGLDLPLDTVRAAAADAAGLAVWSEPAFDPEIQILIAGLTRLTPADRKHVQALIASLLNGYVPENEPDADAGQQDDGSDPSSAPGFPAGSPGIA
jgi:transcriptional regulator with XRE-family HTH domain